MTNEQRPPAGFYPDPSGGSVRRWWDGRAWTETRETSGSDWSTPVGPDGRPIQPTLPAGTSTDTVFVWIFSLLPLLSLAQLPLVDMAGMMRRSFEQPADPLAIYTPGYFLGLLLSFLVYAGSVLLAYLDHRALRRVGVVQPFHWAWTFLSSLAYAIGRAVVLRRRVGSGLAPLWLSIAVIVVATLTIFIVMGVAVADAVSSFPIPSTR